MSNTIQIKRGNGAPPDSTLAPYELGYDATEGFLYIGGALEVDDPTQGTMKYGATQGIKVDFAESAESAKKLVNTDINEEFSPASGIIYAPNGFITGNWFNSQIITKEEKDWALTNDGIKAIGVFNENGWLYGIDPKKLIVGKAEAADQAIKTEKLYNTTSDSGTDLTTGVIYAPNGYITGNWFNSQIMAESSGWEIGSQTIKAIGVFNNTGWLYGIAPNELTVGNATNATNATKAETADLAIKLSNDKASIDTNGYVTGTWLRSTQYKMENGTASTIAGLAMFDQQGWLYKRETLPLGFGGTGESTKDGARAALGAASSAVQVYSGSLGSKSATLTNVPTNASVFIIIGSTFSDHAKVSCVVPANLADGSQRFQLYADGYYISFTLSKTTITISGRNSNSGIITNIYCM